MIYFHHTLIYDNVNVTKHNPRTQLKKKMRQNDVLSEGQGNLP